LIGTPKQHSVYEKQGLQFVENELQPALDSIFVDFAAIANLYLVPATFTKIKKNFSFKSIFFDFM
jgi:hypothetical protein